MGLAVAADVVPPSFERLQVVKIIAGLVGILALAYLAGHRRIQQLERKLLLSEVVAAGFGFVLVGLVASLPAVGILSDAVLYEIRPILPIGLGWIGFVVGYRFEASALQGLSRSAVRVAALAIAAPFVLIVGAALILLSRTTGLSGASFLRDALLLGTAGSMAARGSADLLRLRGADDAAVERTRLVLQLEELAAVLGVLLIGAYFRPPEATVAWQLPGTAWLFITVGMGVAVGLVVYGIVSVARVEREFIVLLLGSICFTAGTASYLRLSPVAVCFIAGAILANLPGRWKEPARLALGHLERPVYLVFLAIAGALWQVRAWQGWTLMVVFFVARVAGRWLAQRVRPLVVIEGEAASAPWELPVAPMGALSIAVVVTAQDLYFGPSIPWIVTAVIGGTMLTEIVAQATLRAAAGFAP